MRKTSLSRCARALGKKSAKSRKRKKYNLRAKRKKK